MQESIAKEYLVSNAAWAKLFSAFKRSKLKAKAPQLVLIRGLPGSGKSTQARAMQGYQHYEADQFFIDQQGRYKFDKDNVASAHNWCQLATEKALRANANVVVSNTLCQAFELYPYFVLAQNLKIGLRLLEAKGKWPSVHQVPDEVIVAMRQSWFNLKTGDYYPNTKG